MENAVIDADVVIVGAGPVGLLLGCELRLAGVSTVLLERLSTRMTESRAAQLTSCTAELLAARGLRRIIDLAEHEPGGHYGGLPVPLSDVDSRFAGNWKIPQYRTEAVLAERATDLGAQVLPGHELVALTDHGGYVTGEVAGPDGPVRVRSAYLVGADGTRSTVRGLAGFTVESTPPTMQMLRADVGGIDIADRRFERLPGGLAVASTRDGVTRVMVHATARAPRTYSSPPDFDEVVQAWKDVTGEDICGGVPIWVDAFDNERGQATSYRRGRVLLAGDAAHWHLPIGGQALNVGLQDAVNLGWKLAAQVHGWAPEGLLDSYHEERHAAGARVLDQVYTQEVLLFGDAGTQPLRRTFAQLLQAPAVRAHIAELVSGLGLRYPLAADR